MSEDNAQIILHALIHVLAMSALRTRLVTSARPSLLCFPKIGFARPEERGKDLQDAFHGGAYTEVHSSILRDHCLNFLYTLHDKMKVMTFNCDCHLYLPSQDQAE